MRRKIDFEEHDAFDNGPGTNLYKEYGGTGYMPLIAMGQQRVIGHSPGDIISALAIEFGPTHIKSRELTALQRDFDTLLGSGTPLLYQGYTRVVGFDQRKIEKEFDL